MHLKNLKGRTIRGGLSSVSAQVASFAVRLTTLMLLARQLKPDDFGLVGMVTAVTGALFFFRDFGLSAASIQIGTITEDQLSSLFWVNIGIGIILALITLIAAPAIVLFYSEPRLLEITAALSAGFILNASGIQHSAVLQRQMRFGVLALVNVISLIVSGAFALIAAQLGAGYWALVIMALTAPITLSTGLWITSGWTPHRPRKGTQIRPLIRFGGLITLNNLVMYVANNSDKVLVGRFLGADALGSYGRAYQLASIPIDNLNSAASEVAFSALSRLKENPMRLKRYFLNGYSLLLLVSIPIAVSCGLFAEDIVRIALGAQWNASVPIFRWLAPTILTSAIISPFGWFIYSLGMPGRGLSMALVLTPALICVAFMDCSTDRWVSRKLTRLSCCYGLVRP